MSTHTLAESPNFITLDCDHALNHAGGDPELLMQLCRLFLDELPLRLELLRKAIASSDLNRAGRALLQLQNCILVFGAGHASHTAQSLEIAIRNRRTRQLQRDWLCLDEQLCSLIPQVQLLMLETSSPRTPIQ